MSDDEDEDFVEEKAIEGEERNYDFTVLETPRALTQEEASDCLHCVGPTYRTLYDHLSYNYPTYAYIAMDVVDREVTDISVIPTFKHVVYLDLTNNKLTDESLNVLTDMEQLMVLIVNRNRIETAAIPEFPRLELLALRQNRITTCQVNHQPKLKYLDLNYNNVQVIDPTFWGPQLLPVLRELELRGNGLKSTAGFIFPNLVSLFLGENDIKILEGLEVLTNLKFLHLRNNPIKLLDGFSTSNRKLFYLNLRGCRIRRKKEIKKLKVLPSLERLVLTGNPIEATENYRIKIFLTLPKLKRIDKTVIEVEEKLEAKQVAKEMNEEEEVDEVEDEEEQLEEDGN